MMQFVQVYTNTSNNYSFSLEQKCFTWTEWKINLNLLILILPILGVSFSDKRHCGNFVI